MFLHPLMLVGLGGAVLPLLLHLLSRARYRDVEWGAMLFLAGAELRQRQSARLTQGLLLAMRMALIATIAITLARPVLEGGLGGGIEGGRATAVILLDCSGSMAFDENGRTRFELARREADEILAAMSPGDRVALLTMGASGEAGGPEPTSDLRSVAARIEQLKPGYGVADLKEGLTRAAELLGRTERFNRDIYVVCDRQALSWRNINESFATDWTKLMERNGPPPPRKISRRLFVFPVGTTDADNISVESVSLVNPPAIRGQPADLQVRLRNYGPEPRSDVPLTIRSGSHQLLQTRVSLPPKRETTIEFEASAADRKIIFPTAGSQVLTAEIASSGYTADDRLGTSIDVIEPIKVLLVTGDERAEKSGTFQSEADFIRWALAPHQAAGVSQGTDPCVLKTIAAAEWSGPELDGFQVVILANIEHFSSRQVRALERYVYDGGRLLVAPGSLSRVEDYNNQLYRDGAGILPAELQTPTPADGSEATSVLGYDATHSIFQFLRGKPDPIPSATIGRYFPAVARQTYAWPLAWYASGDPFLIEGSSERGRVMLMTTSLDADWTTLPLSNFYLPFLQNAVRYLAANPADRDLSPGQPLQFSFPNSDSKPTVTLTTPDGRKRTVDVVHFGRQAEVRINDTSAVGEYKLDVPEEMGRSAYSVYYVVKPPLVESDLTPLEVDRWKFIVSKLGAKRIEPTEQPVHDVVRAGRVGRELWGPGLLATLVLGVMEMAVSRWSSGERRR